MNAPEPIGSRATTRLRQFIALESSGGILMLLAAAAALIAANSAIAETYQHIIHYPVTLGPATHSLAHWVSEWGMVLFFFLIGMELKREMTHGVLREKAQILLPLAAAAGGMLAPALIYLAINHAAPENTAGWAIPTATDIAFALAVLLLAARHTPPALKIFLLALAMFDDLGAILIIALFYTGTITPLPLLAALVVTGLLALLHKRRVGALWPYLLLGALLTALLAASGIHATIGGVITGLCIPHNAKGSSASPLDRGLHKLHPWVSFLLLPLFAFTAAGISIGTGEWAALGQPLALGIGAGLFLGKPMGIMAASLWMVKTGRAPLPEGANRRQLYAVATLAGIGFTMSLFIANLAFENPSQLASAKLGIIAASLLSACVGIYLLKRAAKAARAD